MRGVVLGAQAQDRVHHDGEEGMHGADVVQHVAVLKDNACHGHQEVEPPHHLAKSAAAPDHPSLVPTLILLLHQLQYVSRAMPQPIPHAYRYP
jgi:hypothetical protein